MTYNSKKKKRKKNHKNPETSPRVVQGERQPHGNGIILFWNLQPNLTVIDFCVSRSKFWNLLKTSFGDPERNRELFEFLNGE